MLHTLFVLLILSACVFPQTEGDYEQVEVREYEGERLGSVKDFRENSIRGPQQVDVESYQLLVDGLVDSPQQFSYDEVLSYPEYSKVVTIYCVEGWEVKALWTGVRVEDLLSEVGVKDEVNTVKFYAVDGYTTTLPLQYVRDNNLLLAYEINNMTLPPEQGFPFQLVAESKWGYKWIRWVNHMELTDDPGERGFWEERGYNQNASIEGPIFER